jgi:hypothetical protein
MTGIAGQAIGIANEQLKPIGDSRAVNAIAPGVTIIP